MAKQSFAKKAADAETPLDAGQALSSTSPAVVRDQSLSTPLTGGASGQTEGEVDYSDINVDKLNLVQKSGNLSDNFRPGDFVLGKEVVLSKEGGFELIVLKIAKRYQEFLPYDPAASVRPQVFKTAEEVKAAGGNFNYGEEGYYRDMATVLLLIPSHDGISPDDKENKFIYEAPNGDAYALALWTLISTGYTAAAKKIFTAGKIGHLKAGYEKARWNLSSELKKDARNSWYAPLLRPASKTDEEFSAFTKEVLSTL